MKKSIVVHHWYRAAQWPEGELQIFATVTMDDEQGTDVSQTIERRVNDAKLVRLLNDVDEEIIKILGPEARHQTPPGLDRLPRQVREDLAREKKV